MRSDKKRLAPLELLTRDLPRSLAGFPGWSIIKEGAPQGVKRATQGKYASRFPWIQPSPIHEALSPAVLSVPDSEVREFLDLVVARYVRTLRRFWIDAAWFAARHSQVEPLDDAAFTKLLHDTPASRFLTETLDPVDERRFAPVLGEGQREPKRFLKIDLSAIAEVERLPGMYHAPTVTLLERVRGVSRPLPRAIWIQGVLVRPSDGAAWELARYYVLQGAALSLILGVHPQVHFPMDAINALTKTLLPLGHPVRDALEPHFYLQLPLNYAVLYIDRSVAHNKQSEIYTPFTCTREGAFTLMRLHHQGIEGNSGYPAYRFRAEPPRILSPYGDQIAAYFETILEFTTEIAAGITSSDFALRRWAKLLSDSLPGFPDDKAIFEGDALARVMAWVICDVSIVHSADHHGYSQIPQPQVPLRLRQPPPPSPHIPPLDRKRLVRYEDVFRQRMAWEMYFRPSTLRRLVDVDYAFSDRRHQLAAHAFRRNLRATAAKLAATSFIPLEEIAASIQY